MDYKIVYSKRRTVALVVDRTGKVIVRAPRKVDLSLVERFIVEKQGWIEKQIARSKKPGLLGKLFTHGELFWFLGNQYPLYIQPEYSSKLQFNQTQFIVSKFSVHKAKNLFELWYRNQAKALLQQRAEHLAVVMGIKYSKITITGANTRWGSCSSRGTINFTWRLVMAPLEVVDYVVVHELSHIVQHNHSVKFWKLVSLYAPNFRQSKLWLNRHGRELVI